MTKEMIEKLISDITKMNNAYIEDIDLSATHDEKGFMVPIVSIILGEKQRYPHEKVVSDLVKFIKTYKLKLVKSIPYIRQGKLVVDLHFKDISIERVFQEVEFEQIIIDILNNKSAEIEIEQLIGKMNLLLEKLHIEVNDEKRKHIKNELKNVQQRLAELEYF